MARRIHVIPGMYGLKSDGETEPEIHCRPSSMMSVNISDGNQHAHSAGMNAVMMYFLDSWRPQITGPTTSDTLVLTSYTIGVVGD